jgi:hypothetical protein
MLTAIFILFNLLEVQYVQLHLSAISRDQPSQPRKTRVYIAANHWNDEVILRSHWNKAVADLTKALGTENVFVSIFESGSWDGSKDALRELDQELEKLGVQRNITLSYTTHHKEMSEADKTGPGWIDTPRRKKELRRIPYLSRLRNHSLWNLEHLFEQGIRFDRVLFLNDVVFTVSIGWKNSHPCA